jgi:hypothetical protein
MQCVKKKSAVEGKRYENVVRDRLLSAAILVPETAGSSNRPDVSVVKADGGVVVSIEIKNRRTCEGGQQALKPVDGKITVDGTVLWGGITPSFLKGDKSMETWMAEKANFKGQYFEKNLHSVADYYRAKGSAYMQIEGKGLYHTGIDPLEIGVPLFQAATRLRVRCKQFGRTSIPSAVMSSLVYSRRTLLPSTRDLDKMTDDELRSLFPAESQIIIPEVQLDTCPAKSDELPSLEPAGIIPEVQLGASLARAEELPSLEPAGIIPEVQLD